MSHVLGLDVSTTATKAVLLDAEGSLHVASCPEYTFETPEPLWSEQDPRLWWDGAVVAIREVMAAAGLTGDDIEAVGLAGQMHGLVALDRHDEVLRPAILWNDQRTEAECDQIRETIGRDRLIAVTGNDALAGFTAPKLMWVRRHEPEVWSEIAHVLLPKDFVRLRLTGDHAVDRADGAGTLLFDLAARDWSVEIVDALGIDAAWLPTTYEGPAITGSISTEAADATGLRAGTPVVAGGGDQAAAAVGVGAVEPGIVSLSLGTSGVVFATTDGPLIDPHGRLHAFCHAVPARWHVMGVMLSAAGSLRWFREALAVASRLPVDGSANRSCRPIEMSEMSGELEDRPVRLAGVPRHEQRRPRPLVVRHARRRRRDPLSSSSSTWVSFSYEPIPMPPVARVVGG